MDQQPEQQAQTPNTPPQALPVVPPVTTVEPIATPVEPPVQDSPVIPAPAQTQPVVQPAPVTPVSTEPQQVPAPEPMQTAVDVQPPEQPTIASEPLGRPQMNQGEGLEWQASEYVEHEKSIKWFIVLGVIVVILAALAVFLMKNYLFAVLIVVMGSAIAVWAKRPATEMHYQLSPESVLVNDKRFVLHDFRAFGLLQEGAVYSVILLPNKRFSPGVNIYFPHELGEQIVDTLGAALPMEDIQPDWIDKLTRKLNF